MVVQQIGGYVETRAIYREIFDDDVYLQGGITLPEGGTVVDVGANIGMFVLRLLSAKKHLSILALEPVPALFAALQANVDAHKTPADSVRLFNLAGGDKDGAAAFQFYPRATAFSTMFPEERHRLEPWLLDDLLTHYPAFRKRFPVVGFLLYPFRRTLMKLIIKRRMANPQLVQCVVQPLTRVFDETNTTTVDLLKSDVEGAELSVLRGIEGRHWQMIRQVALEVQDLDGRLDEILALLKQQSFSVVEVVPDVGTDPSAQVRLVYARR